MTLLVSICVTTFRVVAFVRLRWVCSCGLANARQTFLFLRRLTHDGPVSHIPLWLRLPSFMGFQAKVGLSTGSSVYVEANRRLQRASTDFVYATRQVQAKLLLHSLETTRRYSTDPTLGLIRTSFVR
ncbi:hypothetical protein B0J18DRAFT_87594 [Chaetomium sp. MPI-SDFR-AT-0129]|nr:hypothetical protein B0J18DRAFT_87594 [Chaetomium sp. MPI-SDFR-AT-0129]